MYYRFELVKDNKKSGLFHPLDEWNIPKEGGIYELVPRYFETLPYKKNFEGKSESWFKETGVTSYEDGLTALKNFYSQYGISVSKITIEHLDNIVDEDDFQVWCSVD